MKKDYQEPKVLVVEMDPEECCFDGVGSNPDGEADAKEMFFDLDEEL